MDALKPVTPALRLYIARFCAEIRSLISSWMCAHLCKEKEGAFIHDFLLFVENIPCLLLECSVKTA